MGKIRLSDLAKQLGKSSKELLEFVNNNGFEVKSYLSSVSEEDASKIEKLVAGDGGKKGHEQPKEDKKSSVKKQDNKRVDQPFIIRRSVTIDDDQTKQEEVKKNTNNRRGVGFVEDRRNKDYNIVYRNKQAKPMTVDELFGIKKKEPKVENEVKPKVEEKIVEEKKEVVQTPVAPKETSEKANEVVETPSKEATPTPVTTQTQNSTNRGFDRRDNNTSYNKYNNGQSNNYKNNNQFNNRRTDGQFNNRNNSNFKNNGFKKDFNNNSNRNNTFKNNDFKKNFDKPQSNDSFRRNTPRKTESFVEVDISKENDAARDFNISRAKEKMKQNRAEEPQKVKKARKGGEDSDFDTGKLKDLKRQNDFSDNDMMLDYYDLSSDRKRGKKKNQAKQEPKKSKQKIFKLTEITIGDPISVKDLAMEMKKTSGDVITKLMDLGIMATINKDLDFDTAFLIAQEYGITAKKKNVVTEEDILIDETEDRPEDLKPRPPVIVVMGHVDHGKTSLLDAIRKTNVIEGESGGITQHIGAYQVNTKGRDITFLDTPGHEAFTSMRARGAMITDIAILVVAANDGVMPQTVEAINHAKAANIPIIVAVNKMDLPDANFDKVQQELMKYELVPEAWGGNTIYVPISAKAGTGIDDLLEMVLLQADMLELKANPDKQAKGAVIEARLDPKRGPVATMLVQRGKLDIGDTIIVGSSIGRIRTMSDYKGRKVKKAGPSMPVEITGLTTVPESGEIFYEVKDEKTAKHLIEKRRIAEREKKLNRNSVITLDDLFDKIESENLKQLNLIVKADVQGSVEALTQSLEKLSNKDVRVSVIHAVAGGVTESDVNLAKASGAIIIAFNVRPGSLAKSLADEEGVEIKTYSVIYDAINDVEAAMKGMLDPVYKEVIIGSAQVRQTFKVSNVGTIAGVFVTSGKVTRNAGIRVIRDDVVIHDGKLVSLKRFKDDVKEVSNGFECGLQIEGYNDIKEDDMLEIYVMEEVER